MADYKAGDNIDGYCTKCDMILAHTIEAMVDEKPKRTQCNTCKHQHVYRKEKKKPAARKSASKTGAGVAKATDYGKYLEGRTKADSRRYSMKSKFIKGELIDHPKFGLGVTTALKDGSKIEVLFPEGPKTLVHARP